MNRTELVSKVSELADGTKVEAGKYVDAMIKAITDELLADGEVNIVGFGKFKTDDVKEKTGIIQLGDRKGESYTTPAHKKPVLKFGKAFKDQFK